MRVPAALTVLLSLLVVLAARAEEVELNSGVTIKGTVVEDNDREVVIRTDMGEMRFPRGLVKEIRREEPEKTVEAKGERFAGVAWRLATVAPNIQPVMAGKLLLVAMMDGSVAALSPEDGTEVWRFETERPAIAGIAADPGGAYIATADGGVVRLDLRDGDVMWRAMVEGPISGAPLLHRRGVFVFADGRGLFGIDVANGRVRGLLDVALSLDTPLASVNGVIVAGDKDGRLLMLGEQGTETPAAIQTPGRWAGRSLSVSLRHVLLGGDEELVVFDPAARRVVRKVAVPGLLDQPLAADASRAFIVLEAALAGLNPVTGRPVFKTAAAGRITNITITGTSILATNADRQMFALSLADGRVLWTAELSAPAATAPVPAGQKTIVVTETGQCMAFGETTTRPVASADVSPAPGTTRETHQVHSPDGYTFPVPSGWAISEDLTKGGVSLGLRPLPDSPALTADGTTEQDLRRLELTCYMAVLVTPTMSPSTPKEIGLLYLSEERSAAREGGYETDKRLVDTVTIGGAEWNQISLEQVLPGDGQEPERRYLKRAVFRPLGKDRLVWIELKVPVPFRAALEPDFESLAASLEAESLDGYDPVPEVRVAEQVLTALTRENLDATLPHLTGPLRDRIKDSAPNIKGRLYRLIDRTSLPLGKFREVRVRIDEKGRTGYASMLLSEEQDRFLVVEWLHLFR